MKIHAILKAGDFPNLDAADVAQHADLETGAAPGGAFVAHYLPALLAQAHALISSEFHLVASEHGFSPSEWRVLAALADGAPLSISRIAQIVVMKQPTLTKVLDRMEAVGHVRRRAHKVDRRITLVRITAKGQKAVGRLIPLALAHEERVLSAFGGVRAVELKETLADLIRQQAERQSTPVQATSTARPR